MNEYLVDLEKSKSAEPRLTIIKLMTNNLKLVLPLLLILLTAILVTTFVILQPETPPRKPNLTPPLTVSVVDVKAQAFQVNVQSFGTIAPRTQSFLVSQVSGVVTEVSENLREGSFFDKGDVLLRIDNRDYQADLKISQANLADAQQALSEELAQSEQAEDDWLRLGNTEPAGDLVLRKPQKLAALAKLASAQASLAKAQLSLDRTDVTAPYDGRVLNQMVDIGQVAGNNTQIAEVYATDYVEIRLPLRDSDLQFVQLPEAYRGVGQAPSGTSVNIFSSLTEGDIAWSGKVVRTESAIDENARQLHVVAQIDDPFGAAAVGRIPLKIGEYVTAEIHGKLIPDAIVIPASVIYQNTYVYVVEDGVVIRREVDVVWQNTENALIASGLKHGDRLVTTTLGQVASGTRVAIEGEARVSGGQPGNEGAFRAKDRNKSEGQAKSDRRRNGAQSKGAQPKTAPTEPETNRR